MGHPVLSVTHIMLVLVLLSVVGVGMQQFMIQNQTEMHKVNEGCKYAANNKVSDHFTLTIP